MSDLEHKLLRALEDIATALQDHTRMLMRIEHILTKPVHIQVPVRPRVTVK